MEKEYRVSVFGKVFYGVCVTCLLVSVILLMISKSPSNHLNYLFPIFICVVCGLVLVNLFQSRVILTQDSVTRKRAFCSKSLFFNEIKGVRISSRVIVIEPFDNSIGNMSITNYNDLANHEELVDQLRERFTDLNETELNLSLEQLKNSAVLGATEHERKVKLNRMKQIAITYNLWGLVLFGLLFFVRNIYWSVWVGMLYPLLGVGVMKFSYGLIKFGSDSENKPINGIFLGLSMPVIILFLTGIEEFNILSVITLVPVNIFIASILFFLLYTVGLNKSAVRRYNQLIIMAILSVLFGVGSAITINCVYDRSNVEKFKATIADKHITVGKSTHYVLTVYSWKKDDKLRELAVSKNGYNDVHIGGTVNIFVRKGLLGIPWFYFQLIPTPPVPAGLNSGNSPIPR